MKYLLLNIFILSLSISGYSQTDLEKENLKGKVQKTYGSTYKAEDKFGKIEKKVG